MNKGNFTVVGGEKKPRSITHCSLLSSFWLGAGRTSSVWWGKDKPCQSTSKLLQVWSRDRGVSNGRLRLTQPQLSDNRNRKGALKGENSFYSFKFYFTDLKTLTILKRLVSLQSLQTKSVCILCLLSQCLGINTQIFKVL